MAAVVRSLDHDNWAGVERPQVLAGMIGSDARALGGALLPLDDSALPGLATGAAVRAASFHRAEGYNRRRPGRAWCAIRTRSPPASLSRCAPT